MGKLGYYTHYQEPSLGLMQLGVRFYDPEIGRFTQRDPAKDGINWYAYGDNSPIIVVDPTGLWTYSKYVGRWYYIEIDTTNKAQWFTGRWSVQKIQDYLCGQNNTGCRNAVNQAVNEAKSNLSRWNSGHNSCKMNCQVMNHWGHHKFTVNSVRGYYRHIQVNCKCPVCGMEWWPGRGTGKGKHSDWQVRKPYGHAEQQKEPNNGKIMPPLF